MLSVIAIYNNIANQFLLLYLLQFGVTKFYKATEFFFLIIYFFH